MAFIGNTNTTQAFTPAIDYFSGNASTTAFTLSRPVASVAQVQAVVNNVAQNPSDAFTVSGNTITFTSAPSSGTNNIYVYYTSPITQVIAPGQGTVGLTQLSATGTPSSSTYLRGDNAWSGLSATDITAGTLAKARLPAGTVLQVVQTVKTDTFTTTSTTYTDVTGISVSITPTSATSKILVFANLNASVTATDNYFAFQLVRGSTAISIGDTAGSRTVGSVGSALIAGTGSANYILPMAINFLDSPATTSATTYKIQGLVQSGQTLVLNRSGTDSNAVFGIRTASTITVMEIAA
jgi:hypothetical protein